MADNERGEVLITDFAMLEKREPDSFDVRITEWGDEDLLFEMRRLTYRDMWEVEQATPNPAPPITGADRNGRPVYNEHDAGYKAAVREAVRRRDMHAVILALVHPPAGDTLDAQIEALDKMPAAIVEALINGAALLRRRRLARVAERAAGFPAVDAGGKPDGGDAQPADA